jgi:hypothetical protein
MKKMKKLGLMAASVLIVAVAFVAAAWWHSTPRGKLPWSAQNIRVCSKTYGVQGWTYYLRADLPERDFLRFVSRFGATPYGENSQMNDRDGHDVEWSGGPTEWWNPSPTKTNTYGLSNGMGLDILKYENGHVYFKSTGS